MQIFKVSKKYIVCIILIESYYNLTQITNKRS